MSINKANINMVEKILKVVSKRPFEMLELGNQKILHEDSPAKPYAVVAKGYFVNQRVNHTSFDINGLDGAISIDLSSPLPPEYIGRFDVITNFGTTEHIENQFQVFKNIHDACRIDGYMIHSVPEVGFWSGHCPYYYGPEFPALVASHNNYNLIHLEIAKRRKERLVNFIFQKTANDFNFNKHWVFPSQHYKRNKDNRF